MQRHVKVASLVTRPSLLDLARAAFSESRLLDECIDDLALQLFMYKFLYFLYTEEKKGGPGLTWGLDLND